MLTIGKNHHGQLGTGNAITPQLTWQSVQPGCKEIASGGYHTIVLKENGDVLTVGKNHYGQTGNGNTTTPQLTWQSVQTGCKAIAAGATHTIVLK